jgi:fructosamine-3-kinase
LGEKSGEARPVYGGDISSAYCVDTETGQYFLKVNSDSSALGMFYRTGGIQAIEETKTIAVLMCILSTP